MKIPRSKTFLRAEHLPHEKRKYGVYLTTSLALRTLEYTVEQCDSSHEIHDSRTRRDKR